MNLEGATDDLARFNELLVDIAKESALLLSLLTLAPPRVDAKGKEYGADDDHAFDADSEPRRVSPHSVLRHAL